MMYFWLNTVLAEPQAITVSENYHAGQDLSFSEHKIDFTIPYGWTGTAEEMGLLLFSGESTMVIETEFLPDEEDIWAPFKEPLQLHSDVQLTPSKSSSKGLDVQETVQQFQQSYQNDRWNAELLAFYIEDGRLFKALVFGPRHEQSAQRMAIQNFSGTVYFHPFATNKAPVQLEKPLLPEQILMEKMWTWTPNSERVSLKQLHLCSDHHFVLKEFKKKGSEELIKGKWELKRNSLSLFTDDQMRYLEIKEHSGKLVFQNVFARSTPSDLCKDL